MGADRETDLAGGGEPPRHDPPPPGVRAMAIVRWVILALAAVLAAVSVGTWVVERGAARHAAEDARFYCPMHPQIVSHEPGTCPICHMRLEPIPPERRGHVGSHVPSGATPEMAADAGPPAPGTTPPGTVEVTLELDRVQAIGVRTASVAVRELGGSVRAAATVVAPERGASEVHVRTPGFVERVRVSETGARVRRGQEMLSIYSPEVFQAETELLAARAWGGDGAASPAISAARQKLELLGMSSAAIDGVLASGRPLRAIPVVAPEGGHVVKKNVVLGAYVTPDQALYEIVDLSRVWIVAELYPADAARVSTGDLARFSPGARAVAPVDAKIDLVYPTASEAARTTRVRAVVPNPGGTLRPGDWGTLDIGATQRRALTVPRDAIVDTGLAPYVFVDLGEGRFAPRVVRTGAEVDDAVEVVEGLREGERVVSGATFLLDSESRLEASLAGRR